MMDAWGAEVLGGEGLLSADELNYLYRTYVEALTAAREAGGGPPELADTLLRVAQESLEYLAQHRQRVN
jgi:hypothetical protein